MEFGNLKLKHCRYGWMLFCGPYIGKCFELYGQYSESEVAIMRAFLKPGNTVIDVGANIGDLTLPISQMVGDTGKVYAIESHPEVFNILCANLALNQLRNVMPINAFVTANATTDTASPVWGQYAYVSNRWATRFVAIDDLELEALDLVKVDVDGKELEVLQSGAMQIERFRPIIYFENDSKELSPALLSFVMKDLGYKLYWHAAPIFEPDNFFGNPVNHWAPNSVVSMMVLALPAEKHDDLKGLPRIQEATEWWPMAG
jgi:FkbM family methyltransferase